MTSARWTSIETAASTLGLSATALRKALERRARRAADGGTEAEIDGVRARKLGRLWRVSLSAAWGGLDERLSEGVGSSRRGNGRPDEESRS